MAPRPRYRVLLVGVDFSAPSRRALAQALDLASHLEARVEVVYVARKLEPAVPFSRENRAFVASLQRDEVDAARDALAAFLPPHPAVTVRSNVFLGRPHEVLLDYARQVRADLIVLANRGHGLGEKLLIGSTADRVLRKATVPVLLVPPNPARRRTKDPVARRARRPRRTG